MHQRHFASDETPENLTLPEQLGQTKVGGIDLNKPRMHRVAEAVLASSASDVGFTTSGLAGQGPLYDWPAGIRVRRAARRLRH